MQQSLPHGSLRPSTVRDFTTLSPMMSLPSNFGTISLGETFTSILCITNSTTAQIEGVSVHVTLHSTSTKTVLLDTPPTILAPSPSATSPLIDVDTDATNNSSTLEAIVSAEIKELGQHTLTCVVTYRVPAHIRAPQASDDPTDPRKMVFRKHYRFPITNPFNVKTKAHIPKSPSMLMDRKEREKIFLEVHVQNLTSEPMSFERLEFKPVDGWNVEDGNLFNRMVQTTHEGKEKLGPRSLIQPQDTYQYVYVLVPTVLPSFPVKPIPGSTIPLGRLDMAWRSTLGEPGRLLTSVCLIFSQRSIYSTSPDIVSPSTPKH